ncbi:hypothetical protein ES708_19605 [subsurface metagenome]
MYPDKATGDESALMAIVLWAVLIIAVVVLGPLLLKKIRKGKAKTKSPVDPILLNDPSNGKHFTTSISPTEKTVPLYNPGNAAEAGVIKTILEENDIRCLPVSFNDLAYNGMWQTQKGWGILKVAEKDQAKAEELLDNYLQEKADGKTALPDDLDVPPEDKSEEVIFIGQKKLSSGRIFMFTAIILFCLVFLRSGIPSGIGILFKRLLEYLFK